MQPIFNKFQYVGLRAGGGGGSLGGSGGGEVGGVE